LTKTRIALQEEIPDSPLYVDAALVCTGRVPNTKNMGLEKMGIETVRGFVQVTGVCVYVCTHAHVITDAYSSCLKVYSMDVKKTTGENKRNWSKHLYIYIVYMYT
jgi:pyruvate/2-oxoglutarate dehydrogenase complex dihydrolipoamide dehydrogenase (E3) component